MRWGPGAEADWGANEALEESTEVELEESGAQQTDLKIKLLTIMFQISKLLLR